LAAHENIRNELIQRWGPSYASQYGWAAEALGTNRPSFAALERAVGADVHARWLYRMASIAVHAHVTGLTMALPFVNTTHTLLKGPSTKGLARSGSHTLQDLANCTILLVRTHPAQQWAIRLAVLNELVDAAHAAFIAADSRDDDPDSHRQCAEEIRLALHHADDDDFPDAQQ
jgi:hypothetical protein